MRLKALISQVLLISVLGTSAAYSMQEVDVAPVEVKKAERAVKEKGRVLVSIHEVDPADEPIEHKAYLKYGALSFEEYRDISQEEPWCTGDGCDAFLPSLGPRGLHRDYTGEKRLNSVLGGLSGALIGDEIAGAPGAAIFGVIGAAAGYRVTDKKRWEADKRYYEAAHQRGDDLFYNPANRIPLNPHWFEAGPPGPIKD